MPNKNYQKGVRKERKIIQKLKSKGCCIAQRSAGSHSPIDIFAVHKEQRKIFFIQSKPDNFSEKNKEKIIKELDYLNGQFEVKFFLV